MLDWVIIGGGIHGVHMAIRLLGEAGVSPDRLRIVDPGPALLHTWRRCTSNTGMRFLRSPVVHHLDLEPWSLLRHAGAMGRGRKKAKGLFAAPYDRPALALFLEHCDHVVELFGLSDLHVRDRAVSVRLDCDGVRIELEQGEGLVAERVLLAIGASEQPRWPAWARQAQAAGAAVDHIFDGDFVLEPDRMPAEVGVIGGGITGAQVALRLAEAGRKVHLVSRHPLRKHQFDSDPGWIGPKYMRGYAATRSPDARRDMITRARHPGSVPPDVFRALQRAIRQGEVRWHEGEVTGRIEGGVLALRVAGDGIGVDRVVLATGFESTRPGGALIDELVEHARLPCATCGYPVVDTHLRWHPRVFVTGPLAELEIGPVARNIIGARKAAERIVGLTTR